MRFTANFLRNVLYGGQAEPRSFYNASCQYSFAMALSITLCNVSFLIYKAIAICVLWKVLKT